MAKTATKADKDKLKAEADKLVTKFTGEGKTIQTCVIDDTTNRLVFEMAWPDGSPGTYRVTVPVFMATNPDTGAEDSGESFVKSGGLEVHIRQGLVKKTRGLIGQG